MLQVKPMVKETKYSIKDLQTQFPNDAVCLEYLFDSVHARECSCGGRYSPMFRMEKDKDGKEKLVGRKQFQCSKCRFQIAPMAYTIFEKSTSDLTLWFHAIWIFSNAKSGISAKEMERQLGVTYKTAWRMLKLIRDSLRQDKDLLDGTVEVDEAFFGGKGDGGTYNKNRSRVMKEKSKVIAAVERGGKMKAKKVSNLKAETIGSFLEKNVSEGANLMTDASNRYDLVAKGYKRKSVNHKRGQYVRGNVHVNNVESFWSHLRRSIAGTHKSVSKKHLQSYLDGFVFLRNNRGNDRERFVSLLGVIVQR